MSAKTESISGEELEKLERIKFLQKEYREKGLALADCEELEDLVEEITWLRDLPEKL